jgi:hypothetical protein
LIKAEELAQEMNAIFVLLAPAYNHEAAPWLELPTASRLLIIAVCEKILEKYPLEAGS